MKKLKGKRKLITTILVLFIIVIAIIADNYETYNKSVIKTNELYKNLAFDYPYSVEFYDDRDGTKKSNEYLQEKDYISGDYYCLWFKIDKHWGTYDSKDLSFSTGKGDSVIKIGLVTKPTSVDDWGMITIYITGPGSDYVFANLKTTIFDTTVGSINFHVEETPTYGDMHPELLDGQSLVIDKDSVSLKTGHSTGVDYKCYSEGNATHPNVKARYDNNIVNVSVNDDYIMIQAKNAGTTSVTLYYIGQNGKEINDTIKVNVTKDNSSGSYRPEVDTSSGSSAGNDSSGGNSSEPQAYVDNYNDFNLIPGEQDTIILHNVSGWDNVFAQDSSVVNSIWYNPDGYANINFSVSSDITQNTQTLIELVNFGNGTWHGGYGNWTVNVWADPVLDLNEIKLKPGETRDYKINNCTYYSTYWDEDGTNGCVDIEDYYSEEDKCFHLRITANFAGHTGLNFDDYGNPRWYNTSTPRLPIVVEEEKPITCQIIQIDTPENSWTNKETSKFKIRFSEDIEDGKFTEDKVVFDCGGDIRKSLEKVSNRDYTLTLTNPEYSNSIKFFVNDIILSNGRKVKYSDRYEYRVDRVAPKVTNVTISPNPVKNNYLNKKSVVTIEFDVNEQESGLSSTPSLYYGRDMEMYACKDSKNKSLEYSMSSKITTEIEKKDNNTTHYKLTVNNFAEKGTNATNSEDSTIDFKLCSGFVKDKAGNAISEYVYSQQPEHKQYILDGKGPRITDVEAKAKDGDKTTIEINLTIEDGNGIEEDKNKNDIINKAYIELNAYKDGSSKGYNGNETTVQLLESNSKMLKYKINLKLKDEDYDNIKIETLDPESRGFKDIAGNCTEDYSKTITKAKIEEGYNAKVEEEEEPETIEFRELRFMANGSELQGDTYFVYKNQHKYVTGFSINFSDIVDKDSLSVKVKAKPYGDSKMRETVELSVSKLYEDTSNGDTLVYKIQDNNIDSIGKGQIEVTLSGIKLDGNDGVTASDVTKDADSDNKKLIYDNETKSDTTAPTVKVTAYRYDDSQVLNKGELVKNTQTFTSDGEYVINSKWINYGIAFDFESSDNDELKSATWTWNETQSYKDTGDTYNGGSGEVNFSGVRTLTGEGYRKAKFTVTDNSENTTTVTVIVKIDKTAPTVKITSYKYDASQENNLGSTIIKKEEKFSVNNVYEVSSKWLNYPVAFKIEASDTAGEIESGTWQWNETDVYTDTIETYDGGKQTVTDETFYQSFRGNGWRKAKYTIKDEAGNKRTITVVAKIDTTAPTVKVTAYKYDSDAEHHLGEIIKQTETVTGDVYEVNPKWINYPVAFKIEAEDGSGLVSGQWKWNLTKSNTDTGNAYNGGSQNITQENTGTFYQSFTGEGWRKAEYSIKNAAGITKKITFVTKLDYTKPEVNKEDVTIKPEISDKWRKSQSVTVKKASEDVTLQYYWQKKENGTQQQFGEWQDGEIGKAITKNDGNGVYDLYFKVTDEAGNSTTYKQGEFLLDSKISDTEMGSIVAKKGNSETGEEYTFNENNEGPYTNEDIYITVKDGGVDEGKESGHKKTTYEVVKITKNEEGEWEESEATVGSDSTGNAILYHNYDYKVKVTTEDNAGNKKTVEYIIHKGSNITFNPNGSKNPATSVKVTAKLTDEQNEYSTAYYAWVKAESEETPVIPTDWTQTLDIEKLKAGASISSPSEADGNYYLYIKTVDTNGNENISRSEYYNLKGKIQHPGTIEFRENDQNGKVLNPDSNNRIQTKENVWVNVKTQGSDENGTVKTTIAIEKAGANLPEMGPLTLERAELKEEGRYTITLTSERTNSSNSSLNATNSTKYTVYVDKTAPNVTFTRSTQDNVATGKIKVVIDDNGDLENAAVSKPAQTGVKQRDEDGNSLMRYYWTSGSYQPTKKDFFEKDDNYRGNLTSTTQTISTPEGVSGIWVLWIYAEDNVGNVTISKDRTVSDNDSVVDNEKPIAGKLVTTIFEPNSEKTYKAGVQNEDEEESTEAEFTKESVQIELLNGYDAQSGISSNSYKIAKQGGSDFAIKKKNEEGDFVDDTAKSNATYTEEDGPIVLTQTGIYTATVTTIDGASTKHTATRTYTIKIDKNGPIIVENPKINQEYAKQHQITVNITEPDTEVGVNYSKTKFIWVGFDTDRFNGDDTSFSDDIQGFINEEFGVEDTRTVEFIEAVFAEDATEKIEKLKEKGIYIVPETSATIAEDTQLLTPEGVTGRFHLLTYAEDELGNYKIQYTKRYNIDNTVPTKPNIRGVKKELVGTKEQYVNYNGERTNKDVLVIAEGSYSLSGVDKYEVSYTTDNGQTWTEWKDATVKETKEDNEEEIKGKINVSREGRTVVKFRAVAEVADGRLEEIETDEFTIIIDKSGPKVTFENTEDGKNGSNTSVESIKVRATVTDEAGVDENTLKYQWVKLENQEEYSNLAEESQEEYSNLAEESQDKLKEKMDLDNSQTFSNGEPIPSSKDLEGFYVLFVYAKDNLENEVVSYSNYYVFNTQLEKGESPYELERSYIKRVIPDTNVKTFIENVKPLVEGKEYTIKDKTGNVIFTYNVEDTEEKENMQDGQEEGTDKSASDSEETDESIESVLVTTDSKLEVDGKEYTIVVIADLNGDGKLNGIDIARMRYSRVDKIELKGAYEKAADTNNDGSLDGRDLIKMRLLNIGLAEFVENK